MAPEALCTAVSQLFSSPFTAFGVTAPRVSAYSSDTAAQYVLMLSEALPPGM
jgi:hypothetical protein